MNYRDKAVEILKQREDLMYQLLENVCPSFFDLDNLDIDSFTCDEDCSACWDREYKENSSL